MYMVVPGLELVTRKTGVYSYDARIVGRSVSYRGDTTGELSKSQELAFFPYTAQN